MKNVKNLLSKPSPDSRLWAIWIWNKAITVPQLQMQLNAFADKGFGGVAIRPSRDMVPAYLSEEFLSLFASVLSLAKERGIGVRIADDFSMPWSGVFQQLAEQNTAYRAQRLVLEKNVRVNGKDGFEYQTPDDSRYIFIVSKIENGTINVNSAKILSTTPRSASFSWKAAAGEWQMMVFKKEWYLDPVGLYVPNVYNPRVAQVYAQMVLDKFNSCFHKYIPSTFEGLITEMPAYFPSEKGIPWDDDLIIKYKSRYKKNLAELLPSLFCEVDDSVAKNRSHVYTFIYQSMFERFPAFIETLAKKNRMSQWVLSAERDIDWHEVSLRDVIAIPGVDVATIGLQNQEGTEKNYALLHALADINACEFKRETIAVIGRNRQNLGATIQSLKTEIDQLAFAGVSRMILDGCFFNLDQRSYIKTPCNPSWYHPDWNQMGRLCDYASRITSVARQLQRSSPVAVVLPTQPIMADYLPSTDEVVRKGVFAFRKIIDVLMSANIDFDVVTEQYLVTCAIKPNGEFGPATRVRRGNYSAVIFPYSRLISNSTFVFLEKLAIKKGTIVFINEAPQGNFDDGQSASFTSRVHRLTRAKNDSVHVMPGNDFLSAFDKLEKEIQVTVGNKICPDIQTSTHFGSDYTVYYLHNVSDKRDYFATVEIPDVGHIYQVDFCAGECYEIDEIHRNEGTCTLDLDFSPKQTYVLLAASARVPGFDLKKTKKSDLYWTQSRSYRVVLKDRWTFSPDPSTFNILPLASWNKRIGLSRDSGGYSHYYEAYFEVEEVPQTCMLLFCGFAGSRAGVSAGAENFEVSVNGIAATQNPPVSPVPMEPNPLHDAIDRFCGCSTTRFNIIGSVMKGINRVSVRTVGLVNNPDSILFPPLLTGDFSIKKGSRGWTIDIKKTEATYGSWTKNGFPYLCGWGTYEQVFEVPTEYSRIILRLNSISGSVVVDVNGTAFGITNWQPMAFDITKLVEPRRNVVKVSVSNTCDNLLRMNGRPSGLLGEMYLDVY